MNFTFKIFHCKSSFLNLCSIKKSYNFRCPKLWYRCCHCGENSSMKSQRLSQINIQMLSPVLYRQIFGSQSTFLDDKSLEVVISHLNQHNLWKAKTSILPETDFTLPPIYNSNIIEHFQYIATELVKNYKDLILKFVNSELPPQPKQWKMLPGWVCYDSTGAAEQVDFPQDLALVLDVEVCMKDGNYPTLATAVSDKHWYLWCSERLTKDQFPWSKNVCLSDLIPLETSKEDTKLKNKTLPPRVVIGHNVAFDRSFIKEQYFLEKTNTTFLDTMSLHMCVSGLTGLQRAMSMASKKNTKNNVHYTPLMGWSHISSLNNLADVYSLYCKGTIKKAERELFVSGSIEDVKEKFQEAASYCAQDSWATFQVLKKVMPMYLERFPHPVTLFGLLEMSTAYLPINQNWKRYLQEVQSTYEDLQKELKRSLIHLANDASSLMHKESYKEDPWLWNLDWSVQNIKFRKVKPTKSSTTKRRSKEETDNSNNLDENCTDNSLQNEESLNSKVSESALKSIYDSASTLRKVRPFLPGYPAWYRELWDKKGIDSDCWEAGPNLISSQMRCVPKLMRMTWDGFPLHYDEKHGWGYLVPCENWNQIHPSHSFPIKNLVLLLQSKQKTLIERKTNTDEFWPLIKEPNEKGKYISEMWHSILSEENGHTKLVTKKEMPTSYGPYDIGISGCVFFRLPHKDGPDKKVGNPLSKDFLSKIEDNTLRTLGKGQADRALLLSKMLSYWKNAHARIMSQMAIWFADEEITDKVKSYQNYEKTDMYGAILPRLIPAGTVTRRAVEPTWLTASNAYEDRVGSELKAMIQAPPGYHFVGADVDSQELWLAAILGDAQFMKIHGCTAFGWMTLQGKKSAGTDMHSKTAHSVGISRDQAKILNYARIYGAGKRFAQRLLMQFNHQLTAEEAKSKVKKIYSETKGTQKYVVGDDEMVDDFVFFPGAKKRKWINGSESHMFNKLEDIALSNTPRTPALDCRISRALEPKAVDQNFMTSRINWVVQSSAVDFLHLMLVSMRWLFTQFDIQGRFVISIHDEVRYLVATEDRYRAALALQITNLLVRSFFTARLGMNDLPQSVAFFSSVDIDTVLRKEVHMDSVTPSNPHGLERGYGIPPGEALDIFAILKKTEGKLETSK